MLLVALALLQPPADRKDPQQAFEPNAAPGAGQKLLARMAGDWAVDKGFFPSGGGDPVRTPGTCKQELVHGGRFLRSEFVFRTAAGDGTGTGLIGYDPAADRFTSVWADSRQTRLSLRQSEGKFDGGKVVLFGASLDGPPAPGGRRSKTVTTLADADKTLLHRQYTVAPDGTERLIMELRMTRR